MDKAKMIAEIAARHGVRLDKDDPAFLLVDLNMMALEEETGQLSKWKDDVAVLIGALHDGSKKWEDTASAIGKSIFDGHKQAFVKDIEQERTAFLGAARTEQRCMSQSKISASTNLRSKRVTRSTKGESEWSRFWNSSPASLALASQLGRRYAPSWVAVV
jgi:hypothetical protein